MKRLRSIFASVRKLPDYARAAARWLVKRLPLVAGLSAAVLIVLGIVGLLYRFEGSGLSEYVNSKGEVIRAKTLWDWLDLLIVPSVLAAGALWFNNQTRKRERAIEQERFREEALQAYYDKVMELLLEEKLSKSEVTDEVKAVAQVRTITVLRRLDSTRVQEVMDFLRDCGVFSGETAILRNAMMIGINLSRISMVQANLSRTILGNANLTDANLLLADLTEANLSGANLRSAILEGANLSEADLRKANLSGASLIGANLTWAHLEKATLDGAQLAGANFQNAKVTKEQLAKSLLDENTTMPDGSKYKLPSQADPGRDER